MPTPQPGQLSRYRLLAGQHEQADPDWERPLLEDGRPDPAARPSTLRFSAGDVVESVVDLVGRFGAEKFELLGTARSKLPETLRGVLARRPVNDHPGQKPAATPEPTPTSEEVEDALNEHHEDVAAGGPTLEPQADQTPHDGTADAPHVVTVSWDEKHGRLDDKTRRDLIAVASQEGVDVSHCTTRDAVLKALRTAEGSR